MESLDAVCGQGTDDMNIDAGCGCRHFACGLIWMGTQVGFAQDNDRLCPTFPNCPEITFDAPRIEITIEGRQDKHSIDIGHQDLFSGSSSGDFPGELRSSWQNVVDHGLHWSIDGVYCNPVADGGKREGIDRTVAKMPGHFCE